MNDKLKKSIWLMIQLDNLKNNRTLISLWKLLNDLFSECVMEVVESRDMYEISTNFVAKSR